MFRQLVFTTGKYNFLVISDSLVTLKMGHGSKFTPPPPNEKGEKKEEEKRERERETDIEDQKMACFLLCCFILAFF